jgi:hypothetical protein
VRHGGIEQRRDDPAVQPIAVTVKAFSAAEGCFNRTFVDDPKLKSKPAGFDRVTRETAGMQFISGGLSLQFCHRMIHGQSLVCAQGVRGCSMVGPRASRAIDALQFACRKLCDSLIDSVSTADERLNSFGREVVYEPWAEAARHEHTTVANRIDQPSVGVVATPGRVAVSPALTVCVRGERVLPKFGARRVAGINIKNRESATTSRMTGHVLSVI